MVVVVAALDRRLFEGWVHVPWLVPGIDLAGGPRVLGLGPPMLDIELSAGELEEMGAQQLTGRHSRLDIRHGRAAAPSVVKWTPRRVKPEGRLLSVRTV